MIDSKIKAFIAVASNLSFTKASQELCISQPAITKTINALENEYNVRLFNRLGHKIELTKAGRIMLQQAKKIEHEYNLLKWQMSIINNENAGSLKLGASTTISQYILPKILAQFIDNFPKVKISLINGNSRFIEQELINNNIELGLVEGVFKNHTLTYSSFLSDELVCIVGTHNNLIKTKDITLEKFKKLPLVLRENGSGSLDTIEKALNDLNIKLNQLNIVLHLGSTEAIKSFLKNSDALSILSIYSVQNELLRHELKIIDLENVTIKRNLCFVTKQGLNSPLVESFKNFVLYHVGQ